MKQLKNRKIRYFFQVSALTLSVNVCFCQTTSLPVKIKHAEPLFMDLVRDLGARKGEKEVNIAGEFQHHNQYNKWGVLAEYEFAPVNRLGVEIEADFSFYRQSVLSEIIPENRIESIHFSGQYTFLVAPQINTSLAIGYTQAFEFIPFSNYGNGDLVSATVFNPFFVAAKSWNKYIHTLFYPSFLINRSVKNHQPEFEWQINTSILYNFPRKRHFIGLELNQEWEHGSLKTTFHPQVKLAFTRKAACGIVWGIPADNQDEKHSLFIRFIYEL